MVFYKVKAEWVIYWHHRLMYYLCGMLGAWDFKFLENTLESHINMVAGGEVLDQGVILGESKEQLLDRVQDWFDLNENNILVADSLGDPFANNYAMAVVHREVYQRFEESMFATNDYIRDAEGIDLEGEILSLQDRKSEPEQRRAELIEMLKKRVQGPEITDLEELSRSSSTDSAIMRGHDHARTASKINSDPEIFEADGGLAPEDAVEEKQEDENSVGNNVGMGMGEDDENMGNLEDVIRQEEKEEEELLGEEVDDFMHGEVARIENDIRKATKEIDMLDEAIKLKMRALRLVRMGANPLAEGCGASRKNRPK